MENWWVIKKKHFIFIPLNTTDLADKRTYNEKNVYYMCIHLIPVMDKIKRSWLKQVRISDRHVSGDDSGIEANIMVDWVDILDKKS